MGKRVDFTNRRMLYRQVKDFLLGQIQKGVYAPGEVIPAERELADKLGVSRYTVRRAIQELVDEGILYRVQGNGTFVHERKRSAHSRSNSIGIVLPLCDAEMEMLLLNGMQRALRETKYSMTLLVSNNDSEKELEEIRHLRDEQVSGLVIMPSQEPRGGLAAYELKKDGFPFVLVDRRVPGCETDCVMSDNIQGGSLATEYLLDLGHERIAFVKHESDQTSSMKDRFVGYQQALCKRGLGDGLMFSLTRDGGPSEFKALLDEYTAIVAVNGYVAVDVVKMCRELGVVIPDDLSIVSFDDLSITRLLDVPLTAVAQYSEMIGYRAVKLLLEKIEIQQRLEPGEPVYFTQYYYPTKLVERQSCRALR